MNVIVSTTLNGKLNSNSTAQYRKVQISSLAEFPCTQKFPIIFTLFCRATEPFIIPRFPKILKQMQAILLQ